MRTPLLRPLILAGLLLAGAAGAQAPLDVGNTLELAQASPAVRLAEGQLELARGQLAIARSFVSAELGAGYSVTTGEQLGGAEPVSLDDSGFDPVSLRASFNVVPFGPRADGIQKALWQLDRAEEGLRDARADAVIDGVTQYLTALRAGQEIAVQQAAIEVAQTALDGVRTRFAAGAANDAQLLQAEIALSRARNDLAAAERGRQQALATLAQTLGTAVAGVAGEPPGVEAPDPGPTEERLLLRSDVASAQRSLQEAYLDRDAALREALPRGSLSLDYSSTRDGQQAQLGAGFDTGSFQPSLTARFDPSSPGADADVFSIGLSVTVPLDAATPAALDVAARTIAQRELQLQQTLDLARLELSSREEALRSARASRELAGQLLEQSRQALTQARERYALGLIPLLELKQAEHDLLEADLAAARSDDQVLLAILRLARTLAVDPLEVF